MQLNPALPSGETIWIVDDDVYILKIVQYILIKNDIPHRCFESAEALLEFEWDPTVGFIFTDIRMPGMKGDELCRLLRRNYPPHVKIIALTAAHISPAEKKKFVENGFDDVFQKPFTEKDLLSRIAPAALSFPLVDAMIDNEADRLMILEGFMTESARDLETLRTAAREGNMEIAALIAHRLAGRLAQFSQNELSAQFRAVEYELLEGSGEILEQELELLIRQVELLLKRVPALFS